MLFPKKANGNFDINFYGGRISFLELNKIYSIFMLNAEKNPAQVSC